MTRIVVLPFCLPGLAGLRSKDGDVSGAPTFRPQHFMLLAGASPVASPTTGVLNVTA
jgi:hypothetical protein